jgi:outer membrane protein OmpA-like peptidoglycan-associated protein
MKRLRSQIQLLIAGLVPLALLAGCVSAERKASAQSALMQAQTAFRQAQGDPNVQAHAQLALLDAQKTLQAAEQATDVDDIQQLSYLAQQKAKTAATMGEARKVESDAHELSKETAGLIQERREREAKATEARARELETTRQQLEARSREITEAQQKLDAQALQIDQARRAAETQGQEAALARQAAEARAAEVEQARAQVAAKAREAELARGQATAAQAQAATLSRELSELKATETDRGLVLMVGSTFFATGKAELTPGVQRSAEKLAEFLKKNPKRNVLIEGHTDNTGSESGNLKLSEQRADAVKNLLVAKGIAAERITTKGYGTKYPLVSNDTAAGRQQNRRVEVVVLNEGATPQSVGR